MLVGEDLLDHSPLEGLSTYVVVETPEIEQQEAAECDQKKENYEHYPVPLAFLQSGAF